jgi:group I intron endonuclease
MKSFVYVIKNLVNGKIYIGKSNNPEVRFKQHTRSSSCRSTAISRAILKYGEQSFEFKIVGEFQSEEEAYAYEKTLIDSHLLEGHKLYNLSAGGRGILLTPALREKMETVWRSESRLKKISAISKKNWSSLAFRSNMSLKIKESFENQDLKSRHSEATSLGMTSEARKKISETHKGRIQSPDEKASRSTGCLRYWTDERRKEYSDKFTCENNPNAKLRHADVIKCRVLSELFTISESQVARILSLPSRATRNAIKYETWKEVSIKDCHGEITDEALAAFYQLLGEFACISPSAKTHKRVNLTSFAESNPKVLGAYEIWKGNS